MSFSIFPLSVKNSYLGWKTLKFNFPLVTLRQFDIRRKINLNLIDLFEYDVRWVDLFAVKVRKHFPFLFEFIRR